MDLMNVQGAEALTTKVLNWAIIFVRILNDALKFSKAFAFHVL